jgi:hypothetical protein
VKHVLEYTAVEGFLPLARQHAEAHLAVRPWREVLAP